MIYNKKTEFRNSNIPNGMLLSVENSRRQPHPVKDASLTGCKIDVMAFSTKRCIPNGIRNGIWKFGYSNRYRLFFILFFYISLNVFGQNGVKGGRYFVLLKNKNTISPI